MSSTKASPTLNHNTTTTNLESINEEFISRGGRLITVHDVSDIASNDKRSLRLTHSSSRATEPSIIPSDSLGVGTTVDCQIGGEQEQNLLENSREILLPGVINSSITSSCSEPGGFINPNHKPLRIRAPLKSPKVIIAYESRAQELPSSPNFEDKSEEKLSPTSNTAPENSLVKSSKISLCNNIKPIANLFNQPSIVTRFRKNNLNSTSETPIISGAESQADKKNSDCSNYKNGKVTRERKNFRSFFRKTFSKLIFQRSESGGHKKVINTKINNINLTPYYEYVISTSAFLFNIAQKVATYIILFITSLAILIYETAYPIMEFYMQKLGERFKTMDKRELQGKVLNLVDETVDNFGGRKLAEEAQKNLKKRKKLYYRLKRQLFLYFNRPLPQSEAEVIEDARIYCRDYIHDRLKRSGIVISLKHLPVGPPNEISRQIQSMGLYLEAMYPNLFCNIDAQLSGTGSNGMRNNFLTIDRVTYLLSRLAHNLYRPEPSSNPTSPHSSFDAGNAKGPREAPAVIKNAQIYCYTSNNETDEGPRRRRLNSSLGGTNQSLLLNGQVLPRMDESVSADSQSAGGVLDGEDKDKGPDSTITWGTIVALFALAGAFSVSSVLQGRLEFLPIITEKVTAIFKDELAPWIAAQPGGWVALITQYKMKEDTNYRKWQIVLGTVLALAFTVLALETIPNFDEFQHKLGNHTYLFFD